MKILKLLAIDKFAILVKIILKNGGPFGSLYKFWRFDSLQEGTLMGIDCLGNKYYENTRHMIARSRWVEHALYYKWDYDASQVTPEWHGWLHYKTDRLPNQDCAKMCVLCSCLYHRWLLPPLENMSNTPYAYYAYSTTTPRITPWDGVTYSERCCCP